MNEQIKQEIPLSNEAIQDFLGKTVGWSLKGKVIEREFQFKDFQQAMEFVKKVAEIAEQWNHHPDILISYNRVTLTLSTHKVGGLSAKDFTFADKVNRIS